MVKLLSCSDVGKLLRYPLAVWQQDKPDFVLEINGENIGVEQTEAVSKNQAGKDALRNSDPRFQVGYHFSERHFPGETKKNRAKLEQELELDPHNECSLGWVGDECQRGVWAEVMSNTIRNKLGKVKGYKSCAEHWLLIYDNWELPGLHTAEAMRYLQIELEKNQKDDGPGGFEHIWILTGRRVCHVSNRKEFNVYPVASDADLPTLYRSE